MRTARLAERARAAAPPWLCFFCLTHDLVPGSDFRDHRVSFAHDLIRTPGSTFRDRALTLPVQDGDQREQAAGAFEVGRHLALQPLLQGALTFGVDAAAAHVDGLALL